MKNKACILFMTLLVFSVSLLAQEKGQIMPLFQSDSVLHLSLKADFKEVFSNTDDSTDFPATITVKDNEGLERSIDIKLRTRGNIRRESDVCLFLPLRLDFPKKEMKGTPFEGQNVIKLVTHCNKQDEFEQNAILEYLIYKAYNVLTDTSFKVRPAFIKYIYDDKKADTLEKFAFFIEREKYLVERLDGIEIEDEKIHPDRMDPYQMCLMDIFQYMVGNTDYSAYTLHNVVLFSDSLRAYPPCPIPYDFDWSGIISARYAVPHPIMQTEEVSERVYRGFKKEPEVVFHNLRLFNSRKDAIYQLFEGCDLLDKGRKKEAIQYLEEFYYIINHERLVQTEFFDKARIKHD